MDVSDYPDYHRVLFSHPLFRRMSASEARSFRDYYFLQNYGRGEQILFESDILDSLFIVLSGSVSHMREGRPVASYYSGDFWGAEALHSPRREEGSYIAREPAVIFRLRAEGFRRFRRDSPSVRHSLKPRMDDENRLISGFPPELWKLLRGVKRRKGPAWHYQGRSSRKSFTFFMILPVTLIAAGVIGSSRTLWFLPLAGTGLLLASCELFLRSMTLYRVGDTTALKRYFNWRSFRREQDEVPLDQVKSVQLNVRGPLRKVFGIGDLTIQTAGRSLIFRSIDHPAALQKNLMELKNGRQNETEAREKEQFRDLVREKVHGRKRPSYRGAGALPPAEAGETGTRIFRKSPAVLLFQLFMPLSALILTIFPLLLTSGRELPVLSALFWLLRLMLLFRCLWLALDWWNDIYKIELPYIWDIERKPFATKEESTQTDLAGVLNVRVYQKGLLRILLNYGDVIVETPGDSGTLEFFSVSRPMTVQSEIFRFREILLKQKEEEKKKRTLEQFGEFAEILKEVASSGGVSLNV